jgi:hypothetical protein
VIEGMSLLDFDHGTSDDGLKIAHQAGRFRLSGTVDTVALAPRPGGPATEVSARIARTYEVLIQVTFPGRVTQANGQIRGNTVTWRPRLGQGLSLAAEADDSPGPPGWLLPAVVVTMGAAGGALAVWRRRVVTARRSRAASSP